MPDFHPKAQTRVTGLEPAPETRTILQQFTDHQVEVSIAHKARHKAKGNGFGYTELRAGSPAKCLIAKVSLSAQFVHVPSAPRFIEKDGSHWLPSPIELNRIASFPDCFQFAGNYWQQWARVGNSVPPRFMQAIAEHVYSTFLEPAKEGNI